MANLTTLHQSIFTPEHTFKPRVLIPSDVYADMLTLVHNYSTEIGWQGFVRKSGTSTYVIDKILVYPQLVTGVTVADDHDKYAAWIGQIDLDDLNKVRLYAHSHVNMAVSPSGTDLNQFDTYKKQTDDFYIMLIMNKRNELRIDIYEKERNKTYVGCEYLISYPENTALLEEAKKQVAKRTYTPRYPSYQGYGNYQRNPYTSGNSFINQTYPSISDAYDFDEFDDYFGLQPKSQPLKDWEKADEDIDSIIDAETLRDIMEEKEQETKRQDSYKRWQQQRAQNKMKSKAKYNKGGKR